MKIEKLHEIAFNAEEKVHTAILSKPNEAIILFHSGDVVRYYLTTKEREVLFSIRKENYSGGDFNADASVSIYALDEIVVVVSNYKENGYIHYPENYKKLSFQRENYHANISYYPVSLFKDEKGVPHIIYAVAWNHIQIMNLDTRQILTATKSLIEENAAADHIEFYRNREETNKLAWPRSYDYFFGELKISPDKKHFLSAGWAWGSCDAYNIYNVEKFIKSNLISAINIGGWEHDCRATCWVNNTTVAVAYSPLMEDDEGATEETPNEIHFYKLADNKTTLDRKIKVGNLKIVDSIINYATALDAFVVFSKSIGLVILSLHGEVLYENKEVTVNYYFSDNNLFLSVNNEVITISKLLK